MATLTALLDSCVLYPAPIRDLLVRLAGAGLFRAKWTNEIHEEWIRSVLESRPDLSRNRLERTRNLMNEHVLDCLVTEYERHILSIQLPDPNDRHVVAAAITAQADIIVTFNLKDFPASTLTEFQVQAEHPDDFVVRLLEFDEPSVCATIRKQRMDLKSPPKSPQALLDTLQGLGLDRSVARLHASLAVL